MNVWTGTAMLVIAFLLIWAGRPNKGGESPSFLRFHAAMVLYPPLILVFLTFGVAAILSSLLAK